MKYLSSEQIMALHRLSLQRYGGAEGVRDLSLLKSAAIRPLVTVIGQDAYPNLFLKAAVLLEALIRNHPFLDGNKRTAFISAVIFLELNGYRFNADQEEAADFVLQIAASSKKETEAIASWLKKHSQKIAR
jgi:death-on-curing protein